MAVRVCRGIRQSSPSGGPHAQGPRHPAEARRPRRHQDQAGGEIEGRHPGDPDRPPGPLRRRRDPKAAVRASGQDGAARKEPPGRQAGDGTVDRPGARRGQAGSRVRFRPASGPGEPTHPDPAKAEGRATDHGTGTDTDTDTGVWLTACRSSRRSFPPRSEGWSWRGATGWPEKPGAASRGRRHSFVAGTDVHHPTDRSLPMDAARRMVRDTSRACGGWVARLAAEGIPLRKAPERPPPGGHVTARRPAPEGRGGAAPAGAEAGGQGGGQPRGDRRQVGHPGLIGQYPGLHRPCQAPGGPDRTADPEGRDDPAPREGAPDIRAAHPLDIEGKGRGPGGARRSGLPP